MVLGVAFSGGGKGGPGRDENRAFEERREREAWDGEVGVWVGYLGFCYYNFCFLCISHFN